MSITSVARHTQRQLEIDELDRAILRTAAKINTVTYEMLTYVREFDERAGFLKWGFDRCSDWLHWRCDISMNAAREKVRVAHALKDLPGVSEAFEKGQLAYSKVRAMTRVANRANEADLITYALRVTTQRVEERCRQMRHVQPGATESANQAYESRGVSIIRNPDRGVMTITLEVPIEDGDVIVQALDKAAESQPDDVMIEDTSWRARQADGAVAMARSYLAGASGKAGGNGDAYQILIHVDESALAGDSGRSDFPTEAVRRLTCDAGVVRVVDGPDDQPLSVGRKQRTVPPALRRALRARDSGCAFPGCHHTRFLDAHHIKHWAHGGETSMDNLVMLCGRHHRLVHEGGYEIATDHQGERYFRRPDGRAVPALGYRVSDFVDEQRAVGDVPDFHGNLSAQRPTGGPVVTGAG